VPDRNKRGSNIANTLRGDAVSNEIPAEAPIDEPEGE
jgi:hypothetical protein